MERTLILAKPDAYARGLSGEILARFERKGLAPVALRVLTMSRELEMQASEARLAQLSYLACQTCGREVEKDFLICPSCHARLREPCAHCQRPLEMYWSVCPYCETPVAGAAPPRRRREPEAYAGELPPEYS